jgi:hypothetical protein
MLRTLTVAAFLPVGLVMGALAGEPQQKEMPFDQFIMWAKGAITTKEKAVQYLQRHRDNACPRPAEPSARPRVRPTTRGGGGGG